MKKEEIKKLMEEIIKATFDRLQEAYDYRQENSPNKDPLKNRKSRLVFPMYGEHRNHETRISEQELRFSFVEEFNKYCDDNNIDLFYSVETPTKDTYSGFKDKKEEPKQDPNGRSAEFDLVIYNNDLKRVCLVEFKALNADEHDHWKDFVKLDCEKEGDENVLRYFIEILKTYSEGGEKSTIESLRSKNNYNKKSLFFCYAIEGKSQRTKTNNTKKGEDISDKIAGNQKRE